MAIYPCTVCGQRYPQPQQSAYCTVIAGNRPETRKARLCPFDFELTQDIARQQLTSIDVAMQSSLVCEECDSPCTQHVFLTLYAQDSEPAYFAGDFCAVCADARLAVLRYPIWPSRTA